jgi:hypothetical protein
MLTNGCNFLLVYLHSMSTLPNSQQLSRSIAMAAASIKGQSHRHLFQIRIATAVVFWPEIFFKTRQWQLSGQGSFGYGSTRGGSSSVCTFHLQIHHYNLMMIKSIKCSIHANKSSHHVGICLMVQVIITASHVVTKEPSSNLNSVTVVTSKEERSHPNDTPSNKA